MFSHALPCSPMLSYARMYALGFGRAALPILPILPIFSGSARQYETRVAELVLEVAGPLGVLECPLE